MNQETLWEYILHFFQKYGHDILLGIGTTLWIVPISLFFGLLLAIPMGALMASKKSWIVRFPALLVSFVFRGTPMLIQLYIFYYAMGLWFSEIASTDGFLDTLVKDKAFWAILTFSLNTAAYTSEIIRGAIETAPKGELEAAYAFGMNKTQVFYRIMMPGVVRRALPAYSNEVIFMLQGSSILSTIAVMDITQAARIAYGKTYEPYLPFITAGLIYLFITMVIFLIFRIFEKRLFKHLAPIT